MTKEQLALLEEAERTGSFPVTIADGVTYFAWNSLGWRIAGQQFSARLLAEYRKDSIFANLIGKSDAAQRKD